MTVRADDDDQLRRASAAIAQLRRKLAEFQEAAAEPVAVIGMACRFPGAPDCASFWKLIEAGECAGLNVDAARAVGGGHPQYTAKPAALLSDIADFDPAFFDISPREAVQMDPQQRLFLEVAWEALEDAGQTRARLAGSDTGTFVGVHNHSSGYFDLLKAAAPALNEFSGVGSGHDVIPGRLAYVLDLHGPAAAVNTACSSSLVAFHLACQSVLAGDCRMAVAGGVNLVFGWGDAIASLGGMLAADGRCKTFDIRADGFGRGEGCGAVIVKRLSHAIADRDRVLAIVRASVVNQDGRTNGLTAPNGLAQETLLRRALAKAGLRPADVGYVEAHGTGTALGDPIEVEAIANVYGRVDEPAGPCALGSVKANVNHLEGAAGIAGIIKTILALRARTLPPVAGFANLNPHIELDDTRLFVPVAATPWTGGRPRVATVSSFGWSGVNAHVILQEAERVEAPFENAAVRPVILLASTHDPRSLAERVSALAQAIEDQPAEALEDVAWTASVRRTQHEHRFAAVGDRSELIAALRAGAGRIPRDVAAPPPVVGLFFGDDERVLAAISAELNADEPIFAAAVKTCEDAFATALGTSRARAADPASRVRVSAFAAAVGLWTLLRNWGVGIDAVAGTGCGAIAARYVTGTMTLETALAELIDPPRAADAASNALAFLRAAGVNTIVPVGADPTLAGDVSAPFAAKEGAPHAARLWLFNILARLYEAGANLTLDSAFASGAALVSLPSYPFRRRRFWISDLADRPESPIASAGSAPDEWFYQAAWRPLEAAVEPAAGAPFDEWLLVADRGDLAERCARAIEASGERVRIVRSEAEAFGLSGSSRTAVVDLRAVDATGNESAAEAVAMSLRVADLECATADAPQALLFVVTRGAQAPLPFEPPSSRGAAGVWGFCRSLRLEISERWGGVIDLDPVSSPADGERLVEALRMAAAGIEPEIALRGLDQLVPRLEMAVAPAQNIVTCKPDATYLISGAFGVLGPALASYLADLGARHLILLGRTLPGDDSVLRQLRARGVTVYTFACDLGAPGALDALPAELGPACPPVRGVFHLAGSTGATGTRTAADLAAAFDAKVGGALALEAFTEGDELDYFVCFSSAAAVLGERSRAPYAAANACLDSLMAERRARDLPGISINWGLWGGRNSDAADVRFFERSGLAAMPVAHALDAMSRLMNDDGGGSMNWHPLIASLDMARLRAALETRRPAAILAAFDARVQAAGTERARRAIEDLRTRDSRDQVARLMEVVGAEVRAVLELTNDDRLDVERGFFDLGMDSLMSVELKSRLEIALGLTLPITATMDYPSVTALSAHIRDTLFGAMPAINPPAVPARDVTRKREEEDVIGLDDDGVARALAAELRELELELHG